jgi:hypothetical protein
MWKPAELGLALLLLASQTAWPQDATQFWPELDVYLQKGERVRLLFAGAGYLGEQSSGNSAVASYLEIALRPLLRRELRDDQDVFRKRYLTFRAGYRYSKKLSSTEPNWERRAVAEVTGRYPLPLGLLLSDRNRGDFRSIRGAPFSMRYRNRLWLDRDVQLGSLVLTPFVYEELYYDTRYSAWARNRTAIGVQIPVGPRVQIQPYIFRQNDTRSTPRHTDAAGLTLSLFF